MPIRNSEGGMGGRLGRSHMSHHFDSQKVKDHSRIIRRQNDLLEIDEALSQEDWYFDNLPDDAAATKPRKKKKRKKNKFPLPEAMTDVQINEFFDILKGQRTLFYYFKDRYALMLLQWHISNKISIQQLKQSSYKSLLNKPLLKDIMATRGNGTLDKETIQNCWPEDPECYVLTLDEWGDRFSWWNHFNQTSRPGKNLVLQLNLSNKHRQEMLKLLRVDPEDEIFQLGCHPVADSRKHDTLGWVRMDFSDDMSTALIEEVQTDFLREVNDLRKELLEAPVEDRDDICKSWYIETTAKDFFNYYETAVVPHLKIWDEALLAAALFFLIDEIGVKEIFYHTVESGKVIKQLEDYPPPRSIYSDLPKKFCFKKTTEIPAFLEEPLKYRSTEEGREIKPEFFKLEF